MKLNWLDVFSLWVYPVGVLSLPIKLDQKPRRTREGFLEVPVIIAKKMVMPYEHEDNGETFTVNELLDLPYNDPEFVQSCNGLAFTFEHPEENGESVTVNAENFEKYIKGIIINPYSVPDDEEIRGTLRVWDPKIAHLIETKQITELSQGYNASFREVTGTHDGKEYQIIQDPHPFNHLALTEFGRGGESVKVLINKANVKSTVKLNSDQKEKMFNAYKEAQNMAELLEKVLRSRRNSKSTETKEEETRTNEGDEDPDKKKEEEVKNQETTESPQSVPIDQVMKMFEQVAQTIQGAVQALQGGQVQNQETTEEAESEKDEMKKDILNSMDSRVSESAFLAYKNQTDAIQRAAGVVGDRALPMSLRHNSLIGFKKEICIEAGKKKEEVESWNNQQTDAYFEVLTDDFRINAMRPQRGGDSSELPEGDTSAANY